MEAIHMFRIAGIITDHREGFRLGIRRQATEYSGHQNENETECLHKTALNKVYKSSVFVMEEGKKASCEKRQTGSRKQGAEGMSDE